MIFKIAALLVLSLVYMILALIVLVTGWEPPAGLVAVSAFTASSIALYGMARHAFFRDFQGDKKAKEPTP